MGFFIADEKKKLAKRRPDSVSKETLYEMGCAACPLNKAKVTSPKMGSTGADNAPIYVLHGGITEEQDDEGRHLVGDAGSEFKRIFGAANIQHMRFGSVTKDYTPKGRRPNEVEINCCRKQVEEDIALHKPKVVIGLGFLAMKWATGLTDIKLFSYRLIPVNIGGHDCWFFPMEDMETMLANIRASQRTGERYFTEADNLAKHRGRAIVLKAKKNKLGKPEVLSQADYAQGIHIVFGKNETSDLKTIERHFKKMSVEDSCAYDIESHGLRPYNNGAKLLSIAIGTYGNTLAIGLEHPECQWSRKGLKAVYALVEKFLRETTTKKVAHNLPFELEHMGYYFGFDICWAANWQDTVMQAYILDERNKQMRGFSLDDLCTINLGLRIKEISNLDRANLIQAPLVEVLTYNGGDTKYTHKLYLTQQAKLEDQSLVEVYEDALRRCKTVPATQLAGLHVDQSEVVRYQKFLSKKIKKAEKAIKSLPEVDEYEAKYRKHFNVGSPEDVAKVLYEFAGVRSVKVNGKFKADEGILSKVTHPLAKLALDFRGATKLKSTYVDGLAIGGDYLFDDGMLHPVLSPCIAETGRLTSKEPNEQNFPKHKDKYIRSQIVAPSGELFVAADYGQIEWRVIGLCAKDKALKAALWERYDVHKEWAERIIAQCSSLIGGGRWKSLDKAEQGIWRQRSKNEFVFPSCFGAQPKGIANSLGVDEKQIVWLQKELWKQFPGVRRWHEDTRKFYAENFYVETLTGRRRRGPLERNQPINTPVQGTAADVVMDAMARLSEYACKVGDIRYQPVLNIHDDLTFRLPENKAEEYLENILEIMLQSSYKFFDVPILVEVEAGSSWYDLNEVDKFYSDDWFNQKQAA